MARAVEGTSRCAPLLDGQQILFPAAVWTMRVSLNFKALQLANLLNTPDVMFTDFN
ncbi:unnamed protein product [Dovyalis caffra]|uniref:Uncharacterized protein n=1 Tax=Dovyalis caffra TaxID=77055 RepID=A0AAV1SJL6_9ROSI|nr:unnamed protein product [Dovyalis caffra]